MYVLTTHKSWLKIACVCFEKNVIHSNGPLFHCLNSFYFLDSIVVLNFYPRSFNSRLGLPYLRYDLVLDIRREWVVVEQWTYTRLADSGFSYQKCWLTISQNKLNCHLWFFQKNEVFQSFNKTNFCVQIWKMRLFIVLLLAVWVVTVASSQFPCNSTRTAHGTIGYCEQWGFVQIRPKAHTFWWLYYQQTDSTQRPLILWLQVGLFF